MGTHGNRSSLLRAILSSLLLVSSSFLVCAQDKLNPPFVKAPITDTQWHKGSATFYGNEMLQGNSGNCGFPYRFVDNVTQVAVPDPRWSQSLTKGVEGFKGAACGQCYEVKCLRTARYGNKVHCTSDKATRVVITNFDTPRSEGWPNNHFDFHSTGFKRIAALEAGIVNVQWRRVPCPGSTAKFTVKGNPYWHDITVYDVPRVGAITAVWVQVAGSGEWKKARHSWGAHYFLSGKVEWDKAGTRVRAQMAETREFIYPKRVQAA
ncbi:hypothetical protein CLOM_g10703 [Closterium sp. NIES-68]|nr:hypothetical protein CLOM_g10703 [Closterium sp. NIES-68]GJP69926.1 hypothetical protein CLOP_g923 [Closterium sp. NIES-67]